MPVTSTAQHLKLHKEENNEILKDIVHTQALSAPGNGPHQLCVTSEKKMVRLFGIFTRGRGGRLEEVFLRSSASFL